MCKYEMNPASIVEHTEWTWFCPQMDRRGTDGRTDKVKRVYHTPTHPTPPSWGIMTTKTRESQIFHGGRQSSSYEKQDMVDDGDSMGVENRPHRKRVLPNIGSYIALDGLKPVMAPECCRSPGRVLHRPLFPAWPTFGSESVVHTSTNGDSGAINLHCIKFVVSHTEVLFVNGVNKLESKNSCVITSIKIRLNIRLFLLLTYSSSSSS